MSKFPINRRDVLKTSAGALGAALLLGDPLEAYPKGVNTNSSPSALRITDLRVATIVKPGPSPCPIIRIDTNQGVYGLGEVRDGASDTYALFLKSRVVGENPLQLDKVFRKIKQFGGPARQAGGVCAVEMGLWDIAGKVYNAPVYAMLGGGKFRDKIRVYCDTALYQARLPTPDVFAAAASKAVKDGYTAMKFDLDEANDPHKYDTFNWTASPAEVQRMVDQLTAARQAVGPNVDICADMHARYDYPTALQVAKRLEPLNLLWLEEPVPAENVDAYKLIAESTTTPICAGENVYLAHGFRRMLEIGAVDIIMPDLQKTGGLGEGQRIANLANLYYVPFAPHMVASFLGAMASCHVCASVPNFLILEWQTYFDTNAMYKEMVTYDGPWVEKGFITVSDKPGIGVEINEEGMRRYATPNVPFFA